MNKNLIFVLIFGFTLISCTDNIKKENKSKKLSEPIKVVAKIEKKSFERLPVELVQAIFNECNSADITFYEGDKSVNLWDDNVKYILTMITGESPDVLNDNPIGHIMLLKDGDTFSFNEQELSLVEISMKGNDNYVIYKIANKKYYNKINQKGIDFFNKMMGKTN